MIGTRVARFDAHVAAAAQALQQHPVGNTVTISKADVGIDEAQRLCHSLSVHAGWWPDIQGGYGRQGVLPTLDKNLLGTKLALIHSEVSEALEGIRKDTMDTHLPHRKAAEVELADALIRIFDLGGALGYDLAGAMIEKLAYNQQRADHKPEARQATGGKSF